MRRLARPPRPIRPALLIYLASAGLLSGGCLDSEIAKRFREAYGPGFIQGLSTALGQVGQAEAGLRQMGVALADALGAVLQPRTPVSSGSSQSSGSRRSASASTSTSSSSAPSTGTSSTPSTGTESTPSSDSSSGNGPG